MRVDSNTNGHRQWFYFSIKNTKKQTVTLNIYRFKKKFSLFQRGMKPYVRSRKQGNDWKPGGYNIIYKQQKIAKNSTQIDKKNTYYLSFSYKFEHQNDQVFFAACIPYTYTFLTKQLEYYEKQNEKKFKDLLSFKVSKLTKSMCGLVVPLITIQKKRFDEKEQEYQQLLTRDKTTISETYQSTNDKKYIIINARTHSGQTSCSWVLDGILQQITSNKYVADWICDQNICLKIIPMLNPDGVFIGNYRTGIIGDDFNRKFFSGKKQYFPQIHAIKKLISQCKKLGKVELFLDLHGHSVLKNSFIYGPLQEMFSKYQLKNLPFALWHYSKYFRLSSCKFKLQKDKIQTARVFFQINEGILSYTCQNSLGLFYQQKQTFQMVSEDWKSLGRSMAYSFYDCFAKNNPSIYPSPHHLLDKKSEKNENEQQPQQQKKKLPEVVVPISKKHSLNKKQKEENENRNKKINPYGQTYNYSANLQRRGSRVDEMPSIMKQLIEPQQKNKTVIYYNSKNSKDQCFEKAKQKLEKQKKQLILPNEAKGIFKIKKQAPKQDIIRSKFKIKKITQAMNIDNHKSSKNAIYHKEQIPTIENEQKIKKIKDDYEEFPILRANTFDNYEIVNQLEKIQDEEIKYNDPLLQIIQENFSEQYESINDSDSLSDDLCFQEKNYILEHIKANRKNTVSRLAEDSESQKQPEQIDNQYLTTNINGFKEIRFKSVEHKISLTNNKTNFPSKSVKKDYSKLKDGTQKSLRRQKLQELFQDEEQQMISMIQKKKLTQRPVIKHARQPYMLMKLKPNK